LPVDFVVSVALGSPI